jgi:hypothetical protein
MQANLAASKKTGATVLSRAFETRAGEVPPEAARFLLGLSICEEDRERMLELLTKHQRGEITAAERDDLESYVEADNVLSILRAQVLLALKRARQKP